nr:reverse transcriptase domain-containing protein [Tanacetum cinerariifolium]
MSIKLMLFPFSLEGAARIWLEKEIPRSIFTWDDLVSKFINQFFPPSKTTNLRNEITNLQQRFDESFSEAWDIFKDLLRDFPHHGFSELHQLDTFYNALNSKDQDSLNSTAGGNFLDKMPRERLAIIESKSKVRYSRNELVFAKVSMNTSTSGISPNVAELKDMVKALLLDKKSQNQAPATVKAVKESCTLPSNTIANPRSDLKVITTQSGVSCDGPQIPPPPSFLPKVVENEPDATKDTVTPPNNGSTEDVQPLVVQILLWYLDSGCSKHKTEDRSQLTNFVHKFLGTLKFGNDQIAKIIGYGDYQIGNITISRVYYVEGLGHNLFSVGQFCDSDLEVAL